MSGTRVFMRLWRRTVARLFCSDILPLVPGLIEPLEKGLRVCGRGKILNLLAANFPKSRLIGFELSNEAIEFAHSDAYRLGHKNVEFVVRDLSDFDETAAPAVFDLITTFDASHDQANPMAVLRGIRRSLVEGGMCLAQDIKASSKHSGNLDHPLVALLLHRLMHALHDCIARAVDRSRGEKTTGCSVGGKFLDE